MPCALGAARVALGTDLPAIFCNDEALAQSLLEAGTQQDDALWRLPLFKYVHVCARACPTAQRPRQGSSCLHAWTLSVHTHPPRACLHVRACACRSPLVPPSPSMQPHAAHVHAAMMRAPQLASMSCTSVWSRAYEKNLKSKIADMKNVYEGGAFGGAITAALYLRRCCRVFPFPFPYLTLHPSLRPFLLPSISRFPVLACSFLFFFVTPVPWPAFLFSPSPLFHKACSLQSCTHNQRAKTNPYTNERMRRTQVHLTVRHTLDPHGFYGEGQ